MMLHTMQSLRLISKARWYNWLLMQLKSVVIPLNQLRQRQTRNQRTNNTQIEPRSCSPDTQVLYILARPVRY